MKERRRGPAGGSGDASCPQLDGVGAVPARCHTQHAKARQRGSQRPHCRGQRTNGKGFKAGQRKRIQQTNSLYNGNEVTDYFTTNSLAQHWAWDWRAQKGPAGFYARRGGRSTILSLSLSLSQITTSHARAIYPCAHLFLSQPYWHAPRPGKQKEKYAIRSFPSMPKESLFLFTFLHATNKS